MVYYIGGKIGGVCPIGLCPVVPPLTVLGMRHLRWFPNIPVKVLRGAPYGCLVLGTSIRASTCLLS